MPSYCACSGSGWWSMRSRDPNGWSSPARPRADGLSEYSSMRVPGIPPSMEALDIPRLRGLTHAYAFWLALVAAGCLVWLTPGGAPRAAAAVYGCGLCALFGVSALYHRWRWDPRWRPLLRRVDHSNIYLFIAASYTPLGMLVLSGAVQWVVLVTVWGGALAGVTLSIAWVNAPRSLCAAGYVALGWVAVLAFPQLSAELPVVCLALIGGGGLLYTIGAIVFALGRPNPW